MHLNNFLKNVKKLTIFSKSENLKKILQFALQILDLQAKWIETAGEQAGAIFGGLRK